MVEVHDVGVTSLIKSPQIICLEQNNEMTDYNYLLQCLTYQCKYVVVAER